MNDNVSIPATRVVLFPRNEVEQIALAKEFKELSDGFLPVGNNEPRFKFETFQTQDSSANPVLTRLATRLSGHQIFDEKEHQSQAEANSKDGPRNNPLQITIFGKDESKLASFEDKTINEFIENIPENLNNFKLYFKKYMNQKALCGVASYYRETCLQYYFGSAYIEKFGVSPKNSTLKIKYIDDNNIELEFCLSGTHSSDEHLKRKPIFKNNFSLTLAFKFTPNVLPQENVFPIDITVKNAKFEVEKRKGTGLLHINIQDEQKTSGLIQGVLQLSDKTLQSRLEDVFLDAEQQRGTTLLNKVIDFEQAVLKQKQKAGLIEKGLNDPELYPLLISLFSTEKIKLGDVLPILEKDMQLKLLAALFIDCTNLYCLSSVDNLLAKTLYRQALEKLPKNDQPRFIKKLNEFQKKNTVEWFGEYMLDNFDMFNPTLEAMAYEQLQTDLVVENFFLALINNTMDNENAPHARKQNAARVKSTALLVDNIKRDGRAFEQTARTLSLNHKKAIVRKLPSQISPDINLKSIFSILLDRLTPAEKLEIYKSFPAIGSEKSKEAFNLNILQSPEITDFTGNNSQTLLSNSTPLELKTLAVLDTSGKILAKLIRGAETPLRPYNFFERHFSFIFKQKRKENALIEKQRQVLAQIKPNEFAMVFQTATQDSLDSLLTSRFHESNFNKIYTSLTTLLTDNPKEYLNAKNDFTKLLMLSAKKNTPEALKKKMRRLVLEVSTPSSERKYSEALTLELFKILFSKPDYFKLLIVNEQKLSPQIGAALISSNNQELRALINARIKEHKDMHPGFNDNYEVFQHFPISQFPTEDALFSQKNKTTPEKSVLSDITGKILAETIEIAQRKLRDFNSFDVFERQEALDENVLIAQSQKTLSETAMTYGDLLKVLGTVDVKTSETIRQSQFYALRLEKARSDFMASFKLLFRAGNSILSELENTKAAVKLIRTPLSDSQVDSQVDSQIHRFIKILSSDANFADSIQNKPAFLFLADHYNYLPTKTPTKNNSSSSITKVVLATGGSEQESPRSDTSLDLTPEFDRRAEHIEGIAQDLPPKASPAAEKTASKTRLAPIGGNKDKEDANSGSSSTLVKPSAVRKLII